MGSRPDIVTALSPTDISVGEKLKGVAAIMLFVSTWISSLISPFLLANAIWKKDYLGCGVIVGLTACAYAPWKRGFLSNSLQSFVYYNFPRYFQSYSIEYEGKKLPDPSDKEKTFYAVHPHGAFSFGWASLFCSPLLQHVRFCFAPGLYLSPFFRLFSRSTGNPGSAGKGDMISYMKAGEDLALPPGGFEEATLTSTIHDRVFIKKRAGFVKLCLQHGYQIRPVYAFGEKGLYWNIQGAWSFRINILNKNNVPAIVTWGHPLMPLLPRGNVPMKVVVGAPIVMPKIDNPSREVVSQWHAKYIAALTKLFEDHKEAAYGAEAAKTAKLEIW